MTWTAEITYVIDTPVPSCDKDSRVVFRHTDGREVIRLYSFNEVRFPDREVIDDFVAAECVRMDAEDVAAAEAAAEAAAAVADEETE